MLTVHSHYWGLYIHQPWIYPQCMVQSAPLTFFTGKFLLTYCEKRRGGKEVREKRENGEEKKENLKGKRWKIEHCHFLKPLKFVLGLPKWTILLGKIIFHTGKNQENWLCPLWKSFLLHPCISHCAHTGISCGVEYWGYLGCSALRGCGALLSLDIHWLIISYMPYITAMHIIIRLDDVYSQASIAVKSEE